MSKLRPYQQEAIDKIDGFLMFGEGREAVLEAPTSFGKSHIIAEICRNNSNVVVLTNITKLIYQTSDLFDRINIPHSIVKANLAKEPKVVGNNVILAMQQTLASRKELNFKCNILVVDERHISFGSPTMKEIEERLNPKRIIGLSATPFDANGYCLKDVEIIRTTDIDDLTDNGFLCPIETYVAQFSEKLDFSDLDIGANGDYSEPQLSKIVNTKSYNDEVFKCWSEVARSKKTIVFSSGIDHAEALCELFNLNGIKAGVVHSKYSEKENQETMDKFERNEIQVLTSMSQLTTGFSMDDIECGIMCRPTKVRRLFSQCVGRLMRTNKGKDKALFLDFGQCTKEFGLYNEPYEPPMLGDKEALLRAKENNRLDGIELYLSEEEKQIAPIVRDDVVIKLLKLKQNALESNNAKKLISLFEASMDLDELLQYGFKINELKYGEPISQSTIEWIWKKWTVFMSQSIYSKAKNIKSLKTRTKNIIRDGKKLSSLGYFCDWLLEQEKEDGNKW